MWLVCGEIGFDSAKAGLDVVGKRVESDIGANEQKEATKDMFDSLKSAVEKVKFPMHRIMLASFVAQCIAAALFFEKFWATSIGAATPARVGINHGPQKPFPSAGTQLLAFRCFFGCAPY